MMAGSHVVLGAAAWVAVAPHIGLPALSPAPLAAAAAGALLPDIDHPKSWVGRRAWPIASLLGRIVGHRGVTHSLLAVFGCFWVLTQARLPAAWAAPFAVGYLSHLAADLLTPRGLRLAWPLPRTWAIPLCRTGSAREPFVVLLAVAALWLGPGGGLRVVRTLQATWLDHPTGTLHAKLPAGLQGPRHGE